MSRLSADCFRRPLPGGIPARIRRGFTLIEMLMALAIFGIMLALAIPFFAGIARGTQLEGSTATLKNAFLLARQHAITRRQTVFVVFPATDTTVFGGSVSNAAFRGYALATTNEFIGEWKFLPPGIYFDRNYPPNINNLFLSQRGGTNTWGVAIPALWSGLQPAIGFRPNGAIVNRELHPEVALGEGSKLEHAAPLMQGPTRNKIQIYGFTGMPQMMRLDDAR